MKEEVLIIIPAYNAGSTIERVIDEIIELNIKFLIIDDGSTDQTFIIAKQKGAFVLQNHKNQGVGFSIKKGLSYAKNNYFKTVVTIDADGAHNPKDVEYALAHHYRMKSTLTIGSRFKRKENFFGNFPESKMNANRFATYLVNKILDTKLTDAASGFRVFDEKLFKLPNIRNDYGSNFEIIAHVKSKNHRISEIDISVRYDAQILFATRRIEFLNFLDTMIYFANKLHKVQSVDSIASLRSFVSDLSPAKIEFNKKEYFLHPFKKNDAFIFQQQNEYFISLKKILIF